MNDFDWTGRVADVIKRFMDRGREEYIAIVDDMVEGMDSDAILAKHNIKDRVLTSALTDATAIIHNSHPLPALAKGGWYAAKDEGFEISPAFATAWRAAREGGGVA